MIEHRLTALLREAVASAGVGLGIDGPFPDPELLVPKKKEHGDFATNVAMAIAARAGRKPRDVAEAVAAAIPGSALIEKVEVAGPGFINLFVTDDWLHDVVREIAARGGAYGREEPTGRRVQVEFVSANPTGPITIGHARNAVIGDALARLLEYAGWSVEREYYFNDAGGQMDRFGASVEARYLQELGENAEIPEDGYHGAYVADLARDIVRMEGPRFADLAPDERLARLRDEGARRVLDGIRASLDRFGVRFDVFRSEKDLADAGEIADAIGRLRAGGYVYETEGATWFRSTVFGDDKDRVVIRASGAHTYFGADCAYLIDKFARGFDHLIYVWGADHHGDVARVRGAARALGFPPDAVEIVLYQFVSFLRGGEPVKMSKRAGTFVSLDELIEEVGVDAARFTLLLYSNDSPMNFDIEVVKRQSMENPVYYVQYGHARIASILRKAAGSGVVLRPVERADLSLLSTDAEVDLMKALAEVPALIRTAADRREPHRLTHAAQDLAARFHRFYTECRVVSDDEELTQARLWLSASVKQAIAILLGLVGVTAPEAMERLDA